jgi:hypothetical protein
MAASVSGNAGGDGISDQPCAPEHGYQGKENSRGIYARGIETLGDFLLADAWPSMRWREEIDKHNGEAFRPAPKSLAQIVGHPVKGMEDEPM